MGEHTMDADDPRAFYDAYGNREWERLNGGLDGRLEFEETTRHLQASLPESGHVLDVGGGPGRYTRWLADRGYDVTLVDLSRQQLAIAREKLEARSLDGRVSILQGSVTDIGLPSAEFDATLCLGGPLSHLLDATDRARAVREIRRVTTPDAPVFVSVMGLLGAVQLYLLTGTHLEALPALLDHGDLDQSLLDDFGYENAFTATHFYRRDELDAILSDAGLDVTAIVGLEGLASPFHDDDIHAAIEGRSAAETRSLGRVARETNADQVVADISIHMLAIANA